MNEGKRDMNVLFDKNCRWETVAFGVLSGILAAEMLSIFFFAGCWAFVLIFGLAVNDVYLVIAVEALIIVLIRLSMKPVRSEVEAGWELGVGMSEAQRFFLIASVAGIDTCILSMLICLFGIGTP